MTIVYTQFTQGLHVISKREIGKKSRLCLIKLHYVRAYDIFNFFLSNVYTNQQEKGLLQV